MSGTLLVTGFQRAVGWCETAIRTDRSTRERLVKNHDGDRPIQRTEWAGISGNLGGTAGVAFPLVPITGTRGFIFSK